MTVFLDRSSNFHPYECDGRGKCIHCDHRTTVAHDPKTCALCAEGMDREVLAERLFVNEARTILVSMWGSGTIEVALREHQSHTWGPPTVVKEERA